MNPSAPTILVVDDERQIRRLLRLTLEAAAYHVIEAENGHDGLLEAAQRRPDAMILDLGLPDLDGAEVLARLREWSRVPVLILSVRDEAAGKVAALDAGADDYVTKPFDTAELLARLRVILRRSLAETGDPVCECGPLRVDLAAHAVTLGREEIKLTPTEFALLRVLARHAGRIVTHQQLLREVWGGRAENQSQYLRVYITHLRRKLEPNGDSPRLIHTDVGIGYRLVDPGAVGSVGRQ